MMLAQCGVWHASNDELIWTSDFMTALDTLTQMVPAFTAARRTYRGVQLRVSGRFAGQETAEAPMLNIP